MSVYVDDMRAAYGRMKMCHMIADSHDELMAMVVRIGVDPKWIQDAGTHREHFDIALSKRELAISAGAIPLNMRELAGITRARRPARPALTPSETAGPTPTCARCPVCNGAGHQSRPPWVAGDAESWTTAGFETYPCPACKTTGVVWGPGTPAEEARDAS